ncbi:hypothetical protein [Brevibacillus porteri]|uniref:hypothetical protein n=1 Tax=Brevibacillus porteri TaxID=2126350 RepID=UPI003D1C0AFF
MKKYLSILITAALLTVSVGPAYAAEAEPVQIKEYVREFNETAEELNESYEEIVEEEVIESSEEIVESEESIYENTEGDQPLRSNIFNEKAKQIIVFATYIAYRVRSTEKLFDKVLERDVEDAVEKAYRRDLDSRDYDRDGDVKDNAVLRVFDVNNEQIVLIFGDVNKDGMTHIIGRHHPEYFATKFKSGQTFFTPGTDFEYIEEVIISIINTGDVARTIERRINSRDAYEYDGYHNGEKYRMVVEREKIVSVYPVSYNKAQKGD